MCDRCLLEVQDENGNWVGILHQGEPDPKVTALAAQQAAEVQAIRAKAKVEEATSDEEPSVESCSVCGSVVGHTADCSRKGT